MPPTIPISELCIPYLLDAAEKKFNQGYNTMDLMALTKSETERFMVSIVSLLEVEETHRYSGLCEQEIAIIKKYHRIVGDFLSGLKIHGHLTG